MEAEGMDPFVVGDAIAADILERLAPLRFNEAKGKGERESGFRLRYRAVVERNMRASDNFPESLECDEFDPGAVHILGWDGERPIGTCRLVLPVPGRPLPIEEAFGLRVAGSDRMVEYGRMVVDPDYRGRDHGVLLGLVARSWLSMRTLGFTAAVGATPERLVKLFDALGFTMTVIGPPRVHWGEKRCLIVCDGRTAIPGLKRLWAASKPARVRTLDPGSPGGRSRLT
jgi:N-acyl-L-homoserine lactone synthetase